MRRRCRSCPAIFGKRWKARSRRTARRSCGLLAHEARNFEWASEGCGWSDERSSSSNRIRVPVNRFEMLLALRPDDVEADQRLATIYRRLGDFTPVESGDPTRNRLIVGRPGPARRGLALYGKMGYGTMAGELCRRSGVEARSAALRANELDARR